MASILIINGSPHAHGCTATALDEMIRVFQAEGMETRLLKSETKAFAAAFPAGPAASAENACLTTTR